MNTENQRLLSECVLLDKDEIQSLRGMSEAAPDVFRCLRALLCADAPANPCLAMGMQQVFCAAADGETPTTQDEARALLVALLSELACRTAAASKDALTRGRVAVVETPDASAQAAAMVREIQRLRALGVAEWSEIAVLSRTREDLAFVRAEAESLEIPVVWLMERDKIPPLHRIREIAEIWNRLSEERGEARRASELKRRFVGEPGTEPANPWKTLLRQLFDAWQDETADEPAPVGACIDLWSGESRVAAYR